MEKPVVSIIAALGEDRALGKDNRLLWHIPEDLKRFKRLTLGHPCVMGRKTFESIVATLGKPLPGRANIVVTRDQSWTHEGAIAAHSLEEALEKAKALEAAEVFVIGGAQVYEQALPFTDRLHLTIIGAAKEADTFFPDYEAWFTRRTHEEHGSHEGLAYRFVTLER